MQYQVAVPSYKRVEVLCNRTLKTLDRLRVPPSIITVFVADHDEHDVYRKAVPAEIDVVVGVPGLIHQRQWYNRHFYPAGTRILNLDDDVYDVLVAKDVGGKSKLAPFDGAMQTIVEAGFGACEQFGARLWGICPYANAFYMKPYTSVGLKYVCGIFHGSYAGDLALVGKDRPLVSTCEDFETCLRSYTMYGAVVRLDWACVSSKYFAEGGIDAELGGGPENRKGIHNQALADVVSRYPSLAKLYTKAGGVSNIRLKTMPSAKLEPPVEAI